MKPFKVFLIAGYGFTGSGAVHDLMKEFEGHHCLKSEFRILGGPDGLLDLENALVDCWSPWRSDLAVKRFKKLVHVLGRKRKGLLALPGKNFNEKVAGNFSYLSENFINDIVSLRYRGKWSGRKWELSSMEWILYRLRKNILGKKPDFQIDIAAPGEEFLTLAKKYLAGLLSDSFRDRKENTDAVILDLASYHCRPDRMLNYFDNAKMVIVDRDPRDNFVEVKRSIMKNASVEDFILWYRLMRSQNSYYENDKVLKINFEDIVLNYETSLDKIISHLEIDPAVHREKGKYFKPDLSEENIGLWRNYESQPIEKIYSELKEFCRD